MSSYYWAPKCKTVLLPTPNPDKPNPQTAKREGSKLVKIQYWQSRESSHRMALLGDDGRGYELARKLESVGVWRTWLGESNYVIFLRFLDSPSSWDSFMRVDDSKPRPQILLQLRVRALLFDKASVSLFLRSSPSSSSQSSSSSLSVSKLNPTCEFLLQFPPLTIPYWKSMVCD